MLTLITAALALLSFVGPLQDSGSKPVEPDSSKVQSTGGALEYGIKVLVPYVVPGDQLEVVYTIQVKENTNVRPSLLAGCGIELFLGDKSLGPVVAPPGEEGQMTLRKGMKIKGQLPLDVNDLVRRSGLKLSQSETLSLTLGIGPLARASVKVVPDMSDYPLDKLDLTKTRVVIFTDFGFMVAKFFPDKAPNHVKRFVGLAQKHFYDGIQFHRIVPGFMVQGGDYRTRAPGSPSDMGAQPPLKSEFNDIKHVKGILSMARTNDPNSASAQFFLMHGRAPYLDNNYTVFGQVIEGIEVIDKLASQPIGRTAQGEMSRPLKPVWIRKMLVLGVPKK